MDSKYVIPFVFLLLAANSPSSTSLDNTFYSYAPKGGCTYVNYEEYATLDDVKRRLKSIIPKKSLSPPLKEKENIIFKGRYYVPEIGNTNYLIMTRKEKGIYPVYSCFY